MMLFYYNQLSQYYFFIHPKILRTTWNILFKNRSPGAWLLKNGLLLNLTRFMTDIMYFSIMSLSLSLSNPLQGGLVYAKREIAPKDAKKI